MTSIGKNISLLRKKQNLTQEALAEKLFVTRQAISSWETGKTEPDLQTLESIAEALNTDLTELIYGPGHAVSPQTLPYPRFQKKQVLICTVLSVTILLCAILGNTWLAVLEKEMMVTFHGLPYWVVDFILSTLLHFSLGALSLSAIALFRNIHISCSRLRTLLLSAGILMLIIHTFIFEEAVFGLLFTAIYSGTPYSLMPAFTTVDLYRFYAAYSWAPAALSGFLWSLWWN